MGVASQFVTLADYQLVTMQLLLLLNEAIDN
jgi:hypothetical protein